MSTKRARVEPEVQALPQPAAAVPATPLARVPRVYGDLQESPYGYYIFRRSQFSVTYGTDYEHKRGIWNGGFNDALQPSEEEALSADKHILLEDKIAYVAKASYAEWRKTFIEERSITTPEDLVFLGLDTAERREDTPFVVGRMALDENVPRALKVRTQVPLAPRTRAFDFNGDSVTQESAAGLKRDLDLVQQGADYLFWFGEMVFVEKKRENAAYWVPLLRALAAQEDDNDNNVLAGNPRRTRLLVRFLNNAVYAHAYRANSSLVFKEIFQLPEFLDIEKMLVTKQDKNTLVLNTQNYTYLPATRTYKVLDTQNYVNANYKELAYNNPLTALAFYRVRSTPITDDSYTEDRLARYYKLSTAPDAVGVESPLIVAKLTLAPIENDTALLVVDWQNEQFLAPQELLYTFGYLANSLVKEQTDVIRRKLDNIVLYTSERHVLMWLDIGFEPDVVREGYSQGSFDRVTGLYRLRHTKLYTWIYQSDNKDPRDQLTTTVTESVLDSTERLDEIKFLS